MPTKKSRKRPASSALEVIEENDHVAKPAKRGRTSKKIVNNIEKNDAHAKLILRRVDDPGFVLACGQGDVGQLGLGEDVLEKTRFAAVPEYSNIVAIAAGGMHNVCLTSDGKVMTFGCNDEGALGRDTSQEGSETVPGFVNLPTVAVQVTAGDSHSAALLEDGQVFVWGSFRDSHGTMGLLSPQNERVPIPIPTSKKVLKIASGADHLVLIDKDHQVYTCGCGEQGQLGRLPERKTDRHSRQGMGQMLTPGLVYFKKLKDKIHAEDIWAGTYSTFVKTSSDEVYVFGLNNYNQMGLKDVEKVYHPKISDTLSKKNLTHLSSGQHHTIALDKEGKVFVLGRKEYGRLGLGHVENDAIELTKVPTLEEKVCIDVAAGSAQSFAVTDKGELFAWGMGTSGQLGTGEEEDLIVPTLIMSKQLKDVKVVRVAGGGQHTIVLGQKIVANSTTAKEEEVPKPTNSKEDVIVNSTNSKEEVANSVNSEKQETANSTETTPSSSEPMEQ